MPEKGIPTFDDLGERSETRAPVELPQVSTESIDLNRLFLKDVTASGSFDLSDVHATSVGKLLQSLPIPALLIDRSGSMVFANQCCRDVAVRTGNIFEGPVSAIFPRKEDLKKVRSSVESVLLTRKPLVTEAVLNMGNNEIWGRIHLRALRMGDARLVLMLVEDFTLEKKKLESNRRNRLELQNARDELEKRVIERTALLTQTNRRLQLEILERKKAEDELRKTHDGLERRVEERTAELRKINERLTAEIAHRQQAESALREAHQELELRVEWRTEELRTSNQRLKLEIGRRETVEEKIMASLKEKEVLLSEVHHRVKNNLQIICSLLALQSDAVEDPNVLGALKDSQNRIRSMALIHEQLYQSEDLARIDFSRYLTSLAGALRQAYSDKAADVALKTDVPQVFLGVAVALPCGLITNELVTNSLKHAFPGGLQGEVRIEFARGPAGGYVLTVRDDGRGLPEGFDLGTTTSLGLQLVVNLAEIQLRGKLEVIGDHGTVFRIQFPDRDEG